MKTHNPTVGMLHFFNIYSQLKRLQNLVLCAIEVLKCARPHHSPPSFDRAQQ